MKRLSNPEQEELRTEELRCGGVGEGRQGTTRAVGLAVWCGGCGGAPLWGSWGGPVLGSGGGALVGSGGGWPRGGGGGRPTGAWPRAGGAGGTTRALCTWCKLLGTLTFRGGGGGPAGLGWGGSASRAESGAPKLCLRARAEGAASRPPPLPPWWRGPPRVLNLEAVVTTAGLLGGGGGLTAGARRGRLAPPPRLDWEADLVTPGGLLGSGGPVRLRPSGVGGASPGESALRLGLWLEGGGAGGGPRGLTSAGKGAGARRTGGVSPGGGAARGAPPGARLEEAEGCCRELGRGAPDEAVPDEAFPVGRNLGIPPAKSPAKPGGAASFPAPLDGGGLAFLEPSMMGALRSLVTAFLSIAPPRISDSRADRSGGGAEPPDLGGGPPIGGGGGGGGGMPAGRNEPPLPGLAVTELPATTELLTPKGYVMLTAMSRR